MKDVNPQTEQRARDILKTMTLEQKIGQMTMGERMHVTPEDVKAHFLGSVLSGGGSHPGENTPADWVAMNDEFWQALMEGPDALGIPILFGIDAVHGHNNVGGATIFPHNIAFGAANDETLVADAARATAREILASGVEWNFAPTLAVVQNCHWGRTYESFGDDPERAARFGEAYVLALQGEGVMGCAKHWVGDGGTLHGIDQGETTLSWDELDETHIRPYLPALDAGVMSVMVSFNSWNGDKCHGHQYLITDVLKGRLGFDGVVVTDWDGIDYLDEDYREAIRLGVEAGIDMFMVPERWRDFINGLLGLVNDGTISESRIDDAVLRILGAKIHLGLLDMARPCSRATADNEDFGSARHRAIAREVVARSQVLLKNEDQTLPLEREARILVAGRNAHDLGAQCGGWTVSWQGESGNDSIVGTTIWQAISAVAPSASLSVAGDGAEADPAQHDVAVVVIGERAYAEGFGDIRSGDDLLVETGSMINGLTNPLEPYGRSLRLADLHPEDLACIQRIKGAGVPVVALLVSGRPLIVNEEIELSDAFVASWLPGSEGAGLADVLFGDSPFKGRLPLPWPDRVEDQSRIVHRFDAGYGLDALIVSEIVDTEDGIDYKSASM